MARGPMCSGALMRLAGPALVDGARLLASASDGIMPWRGRPQENIVELANGCLCCTVADDFVPALDTILARTPLVEHIVIETSGLALPKPLVQAFQWPAIKSRVTVDGVVAVVDGAALAEGRFAADLDELARQRKAVAAIDHNNQSD